MSDAPARPARTVKLNVINEPKDSYTGGKSSLCPGCGHDQISNVIIAAAWENGIEPHRIAKMSGIGCSSKTPAYYLGQSHGFNTVHGRMPSVTTGAYAVNKDLLYLGVSGTETLHRLVLGSSFTPFDATWTWSILSKTTVSMD